MITYNPAFDLHHSIYRMVHIIARMEEGENFEIDKVRIWDFYLLYPSKIYDIYIMPRKEKELYNARKQFIGRTVSIYDYSGDNRKLFEWIKPVQVSALSCLVSCGILNREAYLSGIVSVDNRMALDNFIAHAGKPSASECNVLSFLSLFSRAMPLGGANGLKSRTKLLESKYDV